MPSLDPRVRENVDLHEKISDEYIDRHSEIYNPIEQERLRSDMAAAVGYINTGSQKPRCLDFGCGRGNLTYQLLSAGCDVTAADITPSFLSHVDRMASRDGYSVSTHLLNGTDLREFPDGHFDLVASYSVLHHVPDYLKIVEEFTRIVKPGGVVYIDHEASAEVWSPGPDFLEFAERTKRRSTLASRIRQLLTLRWYIKRFRKLRNPRFQEEGDIHVWPDDHIEWDKIKGLMREANIDTIVDRDYLLYYAHYDIALYNAYKDKCSDVHLYIGRKAQ